jgi:hypothetical protein
MIERRRLRAMGTDIELLVRPTNGGAGRAFAAAVGSSSGSSRSCRASGPIPSSRD